MYFSIPKPEMKRLERDLEKNGHRIEKAVYAGMVDLAMQIRNEGVKMVPVAHGRLKNSIHVEHEGMKNWTYTDGDGNTYDGGFKPSVGMGETAVGTNVDYGPKIDLKGGKGGKGKGFLSDTYANKIGDLDKVIKKHTDRLR